MNKLHISLLVVFGLLIVLLSALFTVDQRQTGIVFQFGEAVRIIHQPGLHAKIPFIQNIQFLDKRILNVSAEEKELTASDEKRLIVDAFAKYRISNPVSFVKTVHNYSGANLRLNKMLESAMRTVIGRFPLSTLLTEQRSDLMLEIKNLVHEEAKAFGIEIIDVRLLKSDLPQENSDAIYQRMQTERHKEAKQIRAEGEEEAARIRSKADKESKIILSQAYTQSEEIKGQGEGQAASIYNKAYSQDVEFYDFYRSLVVYKKSLAKNTKFILAPNAEMLKHLQLSK